MPITSRIAGALALSVLLGPSQTPAQSPPSDPLYHVEIIVFAYTEGDPLEEDFLHGDDSPRLLPMPTRFALPDIPLDDVFSLSSRPGAATVAENPPESRTGATSPDAQSSVAGVTGEAADLLAGTSAAGEAAAIAQAPSDRLEFVTASGDDRNAYERVVARIVAELPDGFRPLAGDELELRDTRRRLDGLRAYRVLRHVGWQQTGVDTDRSVAIELARLGITNPVGTIEVYRRRFLHVNFELEYFDGTGTFWSAPVGNGPAPFGYARSYPCCDERNAIRSGDVHYVDHPLFGILLQIRPAPEPVDAAENTGAGPAG